MVSTKGGIAWPNVKCWFDPPPPNVCDIFRQKCVNHFWEWKCLIGVVKWSILGNKGTQCYPKGPYYRDRVLIRTFLAFWVPIGSLFIFQGPYFQCFGFIHAKNVNSVCLHVYSSELTSVCLHVYRSELTWFVCDNFLHCYYTNMLWSDASQVILLANFVFFLCVKFHKSLFWVPILAAGGPYWVPISQKVGSLLGPYFKAWGSLIV